MYVICGHYLNFCCEQVKKCCELNLVLQFIEEVCPSTFLLSIRPNALDTKSCCMENG